MSYHYVRVFLTHTVLKNLVKSDKETHWDETRSMKEEFKTITVLLSRLGLLALNFVSLIFFSFNLEFNTTHSIHEEYAYQSQSRLDFLKKFILTIWYLFWKSETINKQQEFEELFVCWIYYYFFFIYNKLSKWTRCVDRTICHWNYCFPPSELNKYRCWMRNRDRKILLRLKKESGKACLGKKKKILWNVDLCLGSTTDHWLSQYAGCLKKVIIMR